MTDHNRGFCFNCAEAVDASAFEEIGSARFWICDKAECQKEFRQDAQAAYEDDREAALQAVDDQWGY